MLNDDKRQLLFARLKLLPEARTLIETICSAPPSRRLDSTGKSVFVQYASEKMGCVIQARGHRTTLPAIMQMEYDDEVLAFYDQPPPFQVRYLTQAGREATPLVYPDFFVIYNDGAGWQEWRSEKDLVQRARKMPTRYVQTQSGGWRCPPGEQYAEQFGLSYGVHSTAEIDWVFQRNISFLEDYLRVGCPDVDERVFDNHNQRQKITKNSGTHDKKQNRQPKRFFPYCRLNRVSRCASYSVLLRWQRPTTSIPSLPHVRST